MNYTKIKTAALLLLASASYLSATTTTLPTSTQESVALINQLFSLIVINESLIKNPQCDQQSFKNKISTLTNQIKDKINSDGNIIKYANPKSKKTILINAAFYGNKDIIEFLLEKGADINAIDIWRRTALMNAIQERQYDTAKLLLNRGADITIEANGRYKPFDGKTALDLANEMLIYNPNDEATKEIIRLLKTARMYLYIKRAFWFLVAVFLLALTVWGYPYHYILEPRTDAKGISAAE